MQVIFHQRVNQPPRCPILRRRVPQNKAPLQGGERIVTPSVKTEVQPGGVSRFTIALDPVPFWNLHLVAENQAAKDHSAVLRADFQAAAYPLGCPHFWGDLEHHGDAAGTLKELLDKNVQNLQAAVKRRKTRILYRR